MALEPSLDLSLVLACYNEEAIFERNVLEILKTLERTRWSYEIIFVEDCSQDRTRELIDRFIASHPGYRLSRVFHDKNVGRGGSVADGFWQAKGRMMGFIDIDLEIHSRYIPTCLLALEEGADIATARRIYRFYWSGLIRGMLSRGYSWLMRRFLKIPLQDTETGFKFFRREKILDLLGEIEDKHWFWDTEVMVRSFLRGYRIVEIPCLFQRRFDKRSTLKVFPDTLNYLVKLYRFRGTLRSQCPTR